MQVADDRVNATRDALAQLRSELEPYSDACTTADARVVASAHAVIADECERVLQDHAALLANLRDTELLIRMI